MPNLRQSPDIEENLDGVIYSFPISGQSLLKDIDMKLGPVIKLDKRNKTRSEKLTKTSCQKIVASLSFF